jgi:hypothetical protein
MLVNVKSVPMHQFSGSSTLKAGTRSQGQSTGGLRRKGWMSDV